MIGLSILLLLGVLDWDDCLSEKSAWDTLAWFAVLVGMAGQLTNLGVVTWMSDCVAKSLQSFSELACCTWCSSGLIPLHPLPLCQSNRSCWSFILCIPCYAFGSGGSWCVGCSGFSLQHKSLWCSNVL
jgi:hypothetical protein